MVFSSKRILAILTLYCLISSNLPISAQAPALPEEDTNIYYGYYWGAAGISGGLLDMYQNGKISSNLRTLMLEVALTALNEVWENRYELANGTKIASWSKYFEGEIYPGQKYGTAGIAKEFLKAYRLTNTEKYLNWAIEGIDELFYEAANQSDFPNWGYAYSNIEATEGISITDISFGSLGILETIIDLYNATQNPDYLNKAKLVYRWLELVSREFTLGDTTVSLLPWYNVETAHGPLYSSYYSGNAAAIPIFLQLGELLNNQSITDWALEILDVFINTQNSDGSWPIILNNPESISRTTFELGSSGILYALNKIDPLLAMENITQTVELGADWIVSNLVTKENEYYIPIDPNLDYGKYGLFSGLIGMLKPIRGSEISKYHNFLGDSYSFILNNISYIHNKNGVDVMGFYPSSLYEPYTDLSYTDGLMGLALDLNELSLSNSDLLDPQILEKYLTAAINTFLEYRTSDGVWPKQVTIPNATPTITSQTSSQNVIDNDEESFWWVFIFLAIPILAVIMLQRIGKKSG